MKTPCYILLDLEWNSEFWNVNRACPNEIIEIGAVKTDETFAVIDTFRVYVKPFIYQVLNRKVQKMTRLTRRDLDNGLPFREALRHLERWIGSTDATILSFGREDINVLRSNANYHSPGKTFPWLSRYVDVQEYLELGDGRQQLGLRKSAEMLGVPVDEEELHQAMGDVLLLHKILATKYNPARLQEFTLDASKAMPPLWQPIVDIASPDIDPKRLRIRCTCGKFMRRCHNWVVKLQRFWGLFECRACEKKMSVYIDVRKHWRKQTIRYNEHKTVVGENPRRDRINR